MRIHADKLLEQMGCQITRNVHHEQTCPVCSRQSLCISYDESSNSTMFTCRLCGYNYNAINFTTLVTGKSIKETINRYSPSGDLSELLMEKYTHQQLWLYHSHYGVQDEIDKFIGGLNRKLVARSGSGILDTLEGLRGGSYNFPRDMGIMDTENIPKRLNAMNKTVYVHHDHLAFAYRKNGYVTGVGTAKPDAPSNIEYYSLTPEETGMFLEPSPGDKVAELMIAPSALTAAALVTRYNDISAEPLAVAHPRNLPLPASCQSVEILNLLDFEDCPLGLPSALRYFSTDNIIDGAGCPRIFVITTGHAASDMAPRNILDWKNRKLGLTSWISRNLISLYTLHGAPETINLLVRHNLSEQKRNNLYNRLKMDAAPVGLLNTIGTLGSALTTERCLAAGRRIIRTMDGFSGFKDGVPISLGNTIFKLNNCILARNGDILYELTVHCRESSKGPLRILLQKTIFRTPERLSAAIKRGFLRRGENIPVILRSIKGYRNWNEIRDAFDDSRESYVEHSLLGVDDNLVIQFPNVSIDTLQNTIKPQGPLPTFPAEVLECYRGIAVPEGDVDFEGFRTVWETDTLEYGALAAGITHVIAQIYAGMQSRRNGVAYQPEHLAYADLNAETWTPCVKQLSELLRGTPKLPALSLRRTLLETQSYSDLGCLPYIARFPVGEKRTMCNLMRKSHVSLLGPIESQMAEFIALEESVTFVALEENRISLPGKVPDNIIKKLQRELPSMLRALFERNNGLASGGMSGLSLLTGVFNLIGVILDISPAGACTNLCKNYYVARRYRAMHLFLHELSRMFYLGGGDYPAQELCVQNDWPRGRAPAIVVRPQKQRVYVHKQLADIINNSCSGIKCSRDVLTKELKEAGHLINSQYRNAYWVLRKEVWDLHVARQLKVLDKPKEQSA